MGSITAYSKCREFRSRSSGRISFRGKESSHRRNRNHGTGLICWEGLVGRKHKIGGGGRGGLFYR